MIELEDIYHGLRNGEFFLEYQPIVSLDDQRVWGAEALIRWQRGPQLIMPGQFIPSVEATPVSGILTYWVVDRIAEDLGDWLRAHRDVSISVNVPPEILGRGGLEYAANKNGLLEIADQIILEITEDGIPDRLGLDALNTAHRRTGVRIALDDVSLSGANLALLSRFAFDFIKIDRVLIDELEGTCTGPTWLDGLSALLQSSSLRVIAEGVETPEQLNRLTAAGILLAQGFALSRPLHPERFKAFHAAHAPASAP
jgi:EAL domain-containing protein (putative c-di-GMP-specific phosphodiesterase class I)